ncbi:hypothetical protein [Sphingorhabdus sp.]|uniref:hypothetical protein n=1 Tax=Sphingorhabdus sp. TaxID=1902408 RepID=UPI0038FCFB82
MSFDTVVCDAKLLGDFIVNHATQQVHQENVPCPLRYGVEHLPIGTSDFDIPCLFGAEPREVCGKSHSFGRTGPHGSMSDSCAESVACRRESMPGKAKINDHCRPASPIPSFSPSPQISNPAVHNQTHVSLTIRSYSLPTAVFALRALTVPKNALARPINLANSLLMGSQ